MKLKPLNRNNLFISLIFLSFCLSFPFLIQNSLGRAIFLLVSLVLWLVTFLYSKNLVLSSILYILIVLPFNVTFQLPEAVEIFNTNFVFPNPYVNGIYVNYLVPTVSVLDLGVFLLICSLIIESGISSLWKVIKEFKNGILIFLIYLVIQSIFLKDFLSIFNSLRVFLYIFTFVSLIRLDLGQVLKKNVFLLGIIFVFNLLFQAVIGIRQFLGGSSLGLSFLGESQVVSGMQGSSFVELGGQLFLRAYGTFPHPNVLSGYLLFSVLLGLILIKKNKMVGILIVLLSFCLLPFTFSRISIILSIASVLLYFLFKLIKIKGNYFNFFPLLFLERFFNVFKGGDSGLSDRWNLLSSALKVIKAEWLTGVGVGSFVKSMEEFVPRTSKGILLLQPVHNIFLLIISELGSIGFLILIYIFLDILTRKKLRLFGIWIVFCIVVIGSFDHYLFSLPQGLILLLSMFFLLCLDLKTLNEDKEDIYKN